MNLAIRGAALALLFTAPVRCLAEWGIAAVSPERARELGVDIRSEPVGRNQVQIELEFQIEGELKDFSEVELRIGAADHPSVAAPLREDRSKPGRVVVHFTADRAQLDKLALWVMVPESLGGTVYDLSVKDFVERGAGG